MFVSHYNVGEQTMKQVSEKAPHRLQCKHLSVAALWRMWGDNLRAWHLYLAETSPLSPANIRSGAKRLLQKFRGYLAGLRADLHHQVSANPTHHFPESDYRLIQLLYFVGGIIPHLSSSFRQRFIIRRKHRIHAGAAFRARLEQIRLHPVAFLSSALAIVVFCALLSLYTVGTSASYNGKNLGTVSGFSAVTAAVTDLEQITRQTLGDASYAVDTSLLDTDTAIVPRATVESTEEFTDHLSEELGEVEYAYALYIDDELVAATTFPGALEELLEQLKLGYITANTVDWHFAEKVEIRQEYVESDKVMNLGYIAEILNATKEGEVTYTVVANDSYYGIAEDYGMSVDELLAMNPGYDPKLLRVGDVLTISSAVPYLTVVNVERQRYVTDVPYSVDYQDDATMYQGDYKVLSAGVYGKSDVTANVTYINGEETAREVVAAVAISEPVTELQARGTIPRPTWFPTGSFRWPCSGSLTSYFGRRSTGIRGASTYHEGIDIANGYGTAIYAADGGTVKTSGWVSGLGYCVIIDHGNGYQTYYGHNSSLLVSAGAHVYKGQQIARMGSTGISSGNHCHFGIKLNGTFVNPLNYL